MRKLNILIAEGHFMIRKGMIQALEGTHLADSILEAKTGAQAVALALAHSIDLIIIAYILPELNGFEVARQILHKKKNIKILVYTQYDELPVVLNFLKIGVKGFLTKLEGDKEITDAIRSIMNGDYYYVSQFDDHVNEWIEGNMTHPIPIIHFSKREIQMVTLLSKGNTAIEVAKEMEVSVRTIETYRYDLIKKTAVSNTAELIGYSYRNGLI
ncbi:MAG: response regulator transcription factor [Cyclobacteriaceae bacterium]